MTRNSTALYSARALVLAAAVASGAACSDSEAQVISAPLTAVCLDREIHVGDWLCGTAGLFECNGYAGTYVDHIYVTTDMIPGAQACGDADLVVSVDGPFAVGDTTVVVLAQVPNGNLEVCSSLLTIVDTLPPEVTVHDFELWPPNHKLHTFAPDDCLDVRDACDPDVAVWFTGAASDEPADDLGDGNQAPDIVDVQGGVQLRAERSGTGNGRVYTLDWHAEDGWGNWVEGSCHVIVPHDQGDEDAVRDADAYRMLITP